MPAAVRFVRAGRGSLRSHAKGAWHNEHYIRVQVFCIVDLQSLYRIETRDMPRSVLENPNYTVRYVAASYMAERVDMCT